MTAGITLSAADADMLMPMHLVVGPSGHILSAGRTMKKLRSNGEIVGARLLEVFRMRRPEPFRGVIGELQGFGRTPVVLEFRTSPKTRFKGAMLPLGDRQGLLINLSFGISAISAVQDYGLSNSDFAATDQTIEMLYLREAKSAMAGEVRKFAARLEMSLDAAQEDAMTDQLTGLGNRRALSAQFEDVLLAQQEFCLLHLDLDFFKQVNDTLGHAAGDHVLLEVASRLRSSMRRTDIVTRIGGDEFILLFRGLSHEARIGQISLDIIDKLEQPITFNGTPCRISGSIGYTLSGYYREPDLAQMIADADEALYAAKNAGRGQAVGFGEVKEAMRDDHVA